MQGIAFLGQLRGLDDSGLRGFHSDRASTFATILLVFRI